MNPTTEKDISDHQHHLIYLFHTSLKQWFVSLSLNKNWKQEQLCALFHILLSYFSSFVLQSHAASFLPLCFLSWVPCQFHEWEFHSWFRDLIHYVQHHQPEIFHDEKSCSWTWRHKQSVSLEWFLQIFQGILVGSAVWRDIFKKYVTSLSQSNYASWLVTGLRHRLCHRSLTEGKINDNVVVTRQFISSFNKIKKQ